LHTLNPESSRTALPLRERALELLRESTGDAMAVFRAGQFEAIEHIVARRGPLLVVQRTGWGKSNVYFIATKLLRMDGAGPALLVSPLLSLMRNQIEAAVRLGIRAERITSEKQNVEEWRAISERFTSGEVDILLISPERLANEQFLSNTLYPIANRIGLFVVDEAHCISDWGHDFRPDYRRITRLMQRLPRNIPVLATTATANNRVVQDLNEQFGNSLKILRGPLARRSLRLQVIHLPTEAARLAWLAQHLPSIDGCGIIYTLTIDDTKTVAAWLRKNGIAAEPYWGGMENEGYADGHRAALEQALLQNKLKALVATTALGMGFDKPDLAFVIHFQMPGSVIHYYQQIGRAGRALDKAYAILLSGKEDNEISDYFINTAFPPRIEVEAVMAALRNADSGRTIRDLQKELNITYASAQKIFKLLSLENPSPLARAGNGWVATAVPLSSDFWSRVERLTELRRAEQAQMNEFLHSEDCLMEFLGKALDDPAAAKCDECARCRGELLVPESIRSEYLIRAIKYLQHCHYPIHTKRTWPPDAFPIYGFTGKIAPELQASEGRALCLWGDAGWGDLVQKGKYSAKRFSDELVDAALNMISEWKPNPAPKWISWVPSLKHSSLVAEFAQRLAKKLSLPAFAAIRKIRETRPQKEMQNSFQQARNLDGAFAIDKNPRFNEPLFLVDDMIDSAWTFTVLSALLRNHGSGPVFPIALAVSSKKENP
jgi:ATP-dependent DNA helicase RecQ